MKKAHPDKLAFFFPLELGTWFELNSVKILKQERRIQNKPISAMFGFHPIAILTSVRDNTLRSLKYSNPGNKWLVLENRPCMGAYVPRDEKLHFD